MMRSHSGGKGRDPWLAPATVGPNNGGPCHKTSMAVSSPAPRMSKARRRVGLSRILPTECGDLRRVARSA